MSRLLAVMIGLAFTMHAPGATAAAPESGDRVSVTVEPSTLDVVLGESADLTVTVANESNAPTPTLVVHIDVTDPERSTSVDPEDWTSTLSQSVGVLDPGTTTTLTWTVQPISPGVFSLYAVAVSPDVKEISVSDVLRISVDDQRSLNPDGILPVALGVPVIVGALLLTQLTSARRGRRSDR